MPNHTWPEVNTNQESQLSIVSATENDISLILDFIRGLAIYEKLEHELVATEDLIAENLFGDQPTAECVIARWDDQPAGFALFFRNFSTFLGKPGIYLEDLFVKPEFRGRGIGKTLLEKLASIAVERGYGRFEWSVLDWNEPAINMYKKIGAKLDPEWINCLLSKEKIRNW